MVGITSNLVSKGILFEDSKTKKLGFEFNNQTGIQAEEIIPDTNNNGKQDLPEILDFIVNNVQSMPVIEQVNAVISAEPDVGLASIQKLKADYLPKFEVAAKKITEAVMAKDLLAVVELKKKEIEVAAIKQKITEDAMEKDLLAVIELKKKTADLQNQLQIAIDSYDPEQEVKIRSELEKSYKAMANHGYQALATQDLYYLPDATLVKVKTDNVDFNNAGKIIKVFLAVATEVKLPNGNSVKAQGLISYNDAGKISQVRLAEAIYMELPDGTGAKVGAITFNDAGNIKGVTAAAVIKVKLPDGTSVNAGAISFNDAGKISGVWLANGESVKLPDGTLVKAKGWNSYNDAGQLMTVYLAEPIEVKLPDDYHRAKASYISYYKDTGKIKEIRFTDDKTVVKLPYGASWPQTGDLYSTQKDKKIRLSEDFSMELPDGVLAKAKSISYNNAGNITGVNVAEVKLKLPDGTLALVGNWIYYNDAGGVKEVYLLTTPPAVKLPDGMLVKAKAETHLFYNNEGQITQIELAEPTTVNLPDGTLAKAEAISYNDAGKITEIRLAEAIDVKLPEGTLAKANVTTYNDVGQITKVYLVEPMEVTIDGVKLLAKSYIQLDSTGTKIIHVQ